MRMYDNNLEEAESRRRGRQLKEEEQERTYQNVLRQQLGEGDHLLDSDQERQKKEHPPPNTAAAFFHGLLLLCSAVGFYYCYTLVLQPHAERFLHNYPFTVIFFSFIVLGFFASFGVLARTLCRTCKSDEAEHLSFVHVGWASLAQAFLIGVLVLFWYLSDLGMCSGVYNQCIVFLSLDIIILVLLTLPFFHERTDILMAIFALVLTAATMLIFWDESQGWEWKDFSEHGKEISVVAAIAVAAPLTVFFFRKSMIHQDTSFIHLIHTHSFFGALFSIAPALGIEVVPNWEDGHIFYDLTWEIFWRLVVSLAFVIIFLWCLKGLSRYSDALTTGYSSKLSVVLPQVVDLVKALIEGQKISEWSHVQLAGFIISLACIAYWFVRVIFLNVTCYGKKNSPGPEEEF